MSELERRIADLDRRERENARITAQLGAVQKILVEDAKQHASKEVVEKLETIQRTEVIPAIAVNRSRIDAMSEPTNHAGWRGILSTALGGNIFKLVVIGLFFVLGVLAWKGTLGDVIERIGWVINPPETVEEVQSGELPEDGVIDELSPESEAHLEDEGFDPYRDFEEGPGP